MLRFTVVALIVALNFVLQATVFRSFAVFGAKPETWLAVVACYAFLRDDAEGAMVGFGAGLLRDVFFGRFLGFFALIGLVAGYLCGKPFKTFFRENALLPAALTVITVTVAETVFYVTHFLVLARLDFGKYFYAVILPETLYTGVVAFPLYGLLYLVNKRLERFESRHFKGEEI